jgi:phenylalanyl-tRNA synthetase beta chain
MRTNLFGGLIATLRHNLNHGEPRLKIFELGRCFLADLPTLAAQPEILAGLVYGARFPEQWGEGGQKGPRSDFFSVKGEIETLLLGLELRFERSPSSALHPGRAATISIAGKRVGQLGELHPRWQQKYDLPIAPILFELDVSAVSDIKPPWYRPASRMQAIRRDIAVVVDESVEIQAILDAVKVVKSDTIIEFSPFDLYRGESVGAGKKSVAFRILMQDTDRTLVDSDADNKVAEILKVIHQEFGATLRK